jgi:EAL domain-containing protein (putative c-di-GMP-specific phosphodiesterase class I)
VVKRKEIYARNQGDRFVLLLKYTDLTSFQKRLDHLKLQLEETVQKDTGHHMNVNFGVYCIPDQKKDIRDAITNANMALEFTQDTSSPSILFYDQKLDAQLKETHERECILEEANVLTDFVTYYQAKVDIRTEKIVGAEALVRFRNPKDPNLVLAPSFFIPYYEKTGRIKEIDFFVLESVCQMLRKRIDAGKKVVPISCNFSRCHFTDTDFPDKLIAVLDRYKVPRDLIEVELTETMVINELQQSLVQQTLDELKRRGIHFSIDDFGSGYSSLGIFEKIPASVIKLDRSFLLNQTDRNRQVKIMKSVVMLADSLDTQVVCEGIETDDDVELMNQIGAYVAQGYRYSKPSPCEKFENTLDLQSA